MGFVKTNEQLAAVICASLSIIWQSSVFYGVEAWRRKYRQNYSTLYDTPTIMMILHGICQLLLLFYYLYRLTEWSGDALPHDELYSLICSLSISASIIILHSIVCSPIRSIGHNIASCLHFCIISCILNFTGDITSFFATVSAVILTVITPPRTYAVWQ